jgi:antitoxin component of MazEF toxin-antitoxin module
MITQQLRKVGNSHVVTIPKSELERLDIKDGDLLSISINKLELTPVLAPELQEILDADLPNLEPMLNYLKDR